MIVPENWISTEVEAQPPAQLPPKKTSLELKHSKKFTGRTLGGTIEFVEVFPLYSVDPGRIRRGVQ